MGPEREFYVLLTAPREKKVTAEKNVFTCPGEVMRVGRKRWKKSAIDVAFYCVPDERGDEPE